MIYSLLFIKSLPAMHKKGGGGPALPLLTLRYSQLGDLFSSHQVWVEWDWAPEAAALRIGLMSCVRRDADGVLPGCFGLDSTAPGLVALSLVYAFCPGSTTR